MVGPSLSVRIWTGVPEPIVVAGTGGFSSCNTVIIEPAVAEQTEDWTLRFSWCAVTGHWCVANIFAVVRWGLSTMWDPQFYFQGWSCYWVATSSYPSDPRLCSNLSLWMWDSWVKAKFFSKLFFPPWTCHWWLGELRQTAQEPFVNCRSDKHRGGGSFRLVLETVPGHVSLAPTIRGQQWTCPAASLSPWSMHLQSPLRLGIRDAIWTILFNMCCPCMCLEWLVTK